MGKSKTVGYRFEGEFSESSAERVLERALAAGVVTEYDTGRGRIVWFNGYAGAELRVVRDEVRSIVEGGA